MALGSETITLEVSVSIARSGYIFLTTSLEAHHDGSIRRYSA